MSLFARQMRSCFLQVQKTAFVRRFQQTKPKLSVSGDVVPVFSSPHMHPDKVVLRDSIGRYTYANLFISAKELSREITTKVEGKTGERIMFLCSNDADYLITLWAIWMSGQIAVPLSPLHPKNILLYYANDTNASLLITTSKYVDLMQRVSKNTNTPLHVLDDKTKLNATAKIVKSAGDLEAPLSISFYSGSDALILYTSGTTGNPKGVVLSHRNLAFQVGTLVDAWQWVPEDVILHVLPLHHVHGIVNALLCPLQVGAKVAMLPKFNANSVWSNLLGINAKPNDRKITVFMAVPTVYSKLMDEYGKVFGGDPKMVEYIRNYLKTKMRLMVSGSAPLPPPIFDRWRNLSGHSLLERYGMTEIGMCLSNLYESDSREAGFVGLPLPGVSIRLTGDNDSSATVVECTNDNGRLKYVKMDKSQAKDGSLTGEVLVKSPGVFKEYFKRPEATKKEFTEDGWFKTGDIGAFSLDKGKFKILGRKSADIIKSGGYKISALDVETALVSHPDIKECVVVGVEDEEWGQKVAALVVAHPGKGVDFDEVKKWAGEKIPKYWIPTVFKLVAEIPKNVMGKVNKKELVKTQFGSGKDYK